MTWGFHDRILDRMAAAYGLDREDLSYLDFFCANYEAAGGEGEGKNRETMDRLPPHRDGSLLSYSVLLTPSGGVFGGRDRIRCPPRRRSGSGRWASPPGGG